MTCGGRSWAGPERGSEILCVLTHGMGSTPPPPPQAMVRYLLELCVQIQQPTYSSEIKNLKLSNGEQHAIRCSGGCSYENQLPQLSLTILDDRPIRKYMNLVFCLFNGHLNASAVVVVQ